MLDDCLRLISISLEVCQADAIDAGWLTSDPAAPDQPGYVEQQWSVVGQKPSYRVMLRTVETGRMDEATTPTKR